MASSVCVFETAINSRSLFIGQPDVRLRGITSFALCRVSSSRLVSFQIRRSRSQGLRPTRFSSRGKYC